MSFDDKLMAGKAALSNEQLRERIRTAIDDGRLARHRTVVDEFDGIRELLDAGVLSYAEAEPLVAKLLGTQSVFSTPTDLKAEAADAVAQAEAAFGNESKDR